MSNRASCEGVESWAGGGGALWAQRLSGAQLQAEAAGLVAARVMPVGSSSIFKDLRTVQVEDIRQALGMQVGDLTGHMHLHPGNTKQEMRAGIVL